MDNLDTEPPHVLVKTWYKLLCQDKEPEARKHAEKMLVAAFGSREAVGIYLRKTKLIE